MPGHTCVDNIRTYVCDWTDRLRLFFGFNILIKIIASFAFEKEEKQIKQEEIQWHKNLPAGIRKKNPTGNYC